MENKFPIGTMVRYFKDCRLKGFKKGTIGVITGVITTLENGEASANVLEVWRDNCWVRVEGLLGADSMGYHRNWMISHPGDLEEICSTEEIESFL